MGHPVALKTKFGSEQFDILSEQRIVYMKAGMRDEFRSRCKEDYIMQERWLTYFLEDETMEKQYKMNLDEDNCKSNFVIFNEQSDICSNLKYFSQEHI